MLSMSLILHSQSDFIKMSFKEEDDLIYNMHTENEDELMLSDDEPSDTIANVGRPTSTVTKPPCSSPLTIEDLWADAIGVEIAPAVDKKIVTTTLVASPDQSLLKKPSPVKIIFHQNQPNKVAEGQNEFPNNNSKRDSGDSDSSNGRLNIKLKAERGGGVQKAETKAKFKNNLYRRNRRSDDLTLREFVKPAQNQRHYELKFEPIRPLFAQTNPMMNNHQAMNQLKNVRDGYSCQGSYNTWQQQSSNSPQSFANRQSNNFNLNVNHKSPLIIQASCSIQGNVGTRTVLKNPNFKGTKQLPQNDFNPNSMMNEQKLSVRSRIGIDDWRGKNPVLSCEDLHNRIKNRTPASTVSSSETQNYLAQIERQKLQRDKFLHDKELRRQKANPDIFY